MFTYFVYKVARQVFVSRLFMDINDSNFCPISISRTFDKFVTLQQFSKLKEKISAKI